MYLNLLSAVFTLKKFTRGVGILTDKLNYCSDVAHLSWVALFFPGLWSQNDLEKL